MTTRSTTTPPRLLSGVQSTGTIHLGNYLGAIKNWVAMQESYESYVFIADLHSVTIPDTIEPSKLREARTSVAAMYIACGMDPKRATIFRQSDVAEHAYAGWLLTCVTPLGWLERMTQFKSKTQNRIDANREVSIGTGLLTYPCLQAADIVLYDADVVPTGEDQKQHLELCRDIVQRFNKLFGSNCLKAPRPMIQKSGSRIMGLDDPSAKMSKSTGERNQGHAIWLVDSPDAIVRKFRRAKTDLGSAVDIAQMSDGVSNLVEIYGTCAGLTPESARVHFDGKPYSALKQEVADVVIEMLRPIQQRYAELISDPEMLERILLDGASKARDHAGATLKRMRSAMGLQ